MTLIQFIIFAVATLAQSDQVLESDDHIFGIVEKYDMGPRDMLLTPAQKAAMKTRSAYLNIVKWPNGTIPYTVDSRFEAIKSRMAALNQAIQDYNDNTCIRLVPRTNEKNYVNFINGDGCYSYLGVSGGKQPISFGSGCDTTRGTPVHEIMHALGFMHEHQRPDRDDYITVNMQYIEKGAEDNFDKVKSSEANLLDTAYDLTSVMHYGKWSFSTSDNHNTIDTKDPVYEDRIGQRKFFSKCDLARINKLYECSNFDTTCSNTGATTPSIKTVKTSSTPPVTTTRSRSCRRH